MAIAVATLWVVSVGGDAEDNLPASSFDALPMTHFARTLSPCDAFWRTVSCFRRGILVILATLIAHRPLPHGNFRPDPWPTLDNKLFTFIDSS